ncbi:type I restriction-modification system subunit M [Psychrobacter sp. I-STPA6b]|uniref:class I SAM-dependent DNA methyltransferase n=1 Tax=Psychrobacter sp. I-STPA6b TaxID=2585718 RepID=UPI001D0C8290|nr:type I restriction-modification system subunit M [Psychrobacter sp. I-STPA6b]
MSTQPSSQAIVQKLWNLCDVLRDDGINYSDYVTELVLLLFIKMEYENTEQGVLVAHKLPEGCRWTDINQLSGLNLLNKYKQVLLDLSQSQDRLIAAIYSNAQTRLREPRHLEQLVKTLDGLDWFSLKNDGLGDLYEGLLEKNANETKSGAGQYFTPRVLIDSMVNCIQPQAGEVIQDPAAGTAGFLIAANEYIKRQTDEYYDLSAAQIKFQKNKAFVGVELVPSTRRLALMNCLLHGIEGGSEGDSEGVVLQGNSLGQVGASLNRADVILANPPFGAAKGGEASITRDDLTFKTSNKQLAFLQHIYRNLKAGGRAAVVLPDNVLFEAGIGTDIRQDLMHKCNLHTILRLPTGIFYAQGVKTNVLFFTKGTASNPDQDQNCTKNVWVYDLRTNMPSFGKRTPFSPEHLKPFEAVYGKNADGTSPRTEGEWSFCDNNESDKNSLSNSCDVDNNDDNDNPTLESSRWRVFSRDWIRDNKGDSLDISWLKDSDSIDAADLPEPHILASEAMNELTEALRQLDGLMQALGQQDEADVQKKLLAESLGLSEGDV